MKVKAILMSLLTLIVLTFPIAADSTFGDELYTHSEFAPEGIIEVLPDSVKEKLPPGDVFSSDGFFDRFSVNYFFSLIADTFSEALAPALKRFLVTLSLVIISSVLAMLKRTAGSESAASVFSFVSSLCIILTLYRQTVSLLETVNIYITGLSTAVSAMVPVTVAIGTAGGNLSASAVSAGGMMIGLAFVENLASAGLMPVLRLCFGMSVASCMGSGINLGGISKLVRGIFTWILALTSAVISAVMTFQTSIASHADSLSMRAVKFAASNAIPVVGGIAGDAVRAVAGSLTLVKSTVGWVGVILIVMMTLPVIVEVLLARLGIRISETAADIIGLEREKNILADIGGLYGFLAAVCVISGLMFIYAMALFAGSTSASL